MAWDLARALAMRLIGFSVRPIPPPHHRREPSDVEKRSQFQGDEKKICNETGLDYIFHSVIPPPILRNFFKEARRGTAALCLFIFLAVQAMVAVPALHALVHANSSDPTHQCAVTLLLHGQVHASSPAVGAVRNAPAYASEPFLAAAVFASADVRLLPCRGPPADRSLI